MKHPCLLLMRHAKSSWKQQDLTDHERPLKKRGRRQAALMGDFLRSQQFSINRVISSTAVRALQTAEIVAPAVGVTQVETDPRLYEAGLDRWRQILAESSPADSVLLVGHNPGMEELLQSISGEVVRFTPGSVAVLYRQPDRLFSTIESLELAQVWRPRDITSE